MGIINAAYRFPGHLGTSVFRPGDPSRSPYQVIFGFQSEPDLRDWELSDERKRWLERLTSEAREDPREERISGLEAWFAQPDEPLPRTPPRYKTLAVTLLAAWPIITLLFLVFGPVLFRLPLLLRTAALSASMLSLMTYVVMPRMTRLFAPWLRASSPSGPKQ